MFGRKRHAAEDSSASVPQLSDERIFKLVHEQLSAFIGEHGAWTVSRREVDEDALFHGILAHSVAAQITAAIAAEYGIIVAAADAAPTTSDDEPETRWVPAPITMFADLRRPVTGEVPSIGTREREDRDSLVA